MIKTGIIITAILLPASLQLQILNAGEFNPVPSHWRWVGSNEAVFTFDGTYADSAGFVYNALTGLSRPIDSRVVTSSILKYDLPEDAVNPVLSPDSTKVAYTLRNDLYFKELRSGKIHRLTYDGSETTLNGYASWVYYEEIFGRHTNYKAFWWSPDSRKIAFYRFDNSQVPLFPICSPFGQDGTLLRTRYPKAGESNPEVSVYVADLEAPVRRSLRHLAIDNNAEYLGTPFWSPDSDYLYVPAEPRMQNALDLYRVNVKSGANDCIYHESSDTWLDWIDGMLFTRKGLYMARSFESGWQQIYFLSYDGELRRLTEGRNWRIALLAENEGEVYFTANRDMSVRTGLYRLGLGGEIEALVDTSLNVSGVIFSPDFSRFIASVSNFRTPTQVRMYETGKSYMVVSDMKGDGYVESKYCLPKLIYIENDGFRLPGYIVYPYNFDPSRKYPVHVALYGGPDTPMVRERWLAPSGEMQWRAENGIISITIDCRAAGHNGRAGLDMVYRHLNTVEIDDFKAWGRYLQSLPYVAPDKIGVEGFSFGGTVTAMLLFTASDIFHYGIAGGGVYDWSLYDTHYTERFMRTPEGNPDGYAHSRVISHVASYPAVYSDSSSIVPPVMLKLTHGTGDDNVHFQNTLQLIDELQRQGKHFEFMIYPDGKHGYRGYQGRHSREADRDFWRRHLLSLQ